MDERDKCVQGLAWEGGILVEYRPHPLISVHLSRAEGWDLEANGGGLSRFWERY